MPRASWLLTRLSTGHFFSDTYAGFMLPLLPMLSQELGFGLGATGILLTCSSFTSSIVQPAFGWLSDRFAGVNFSLVGVLVAAVFISLIGWSPSFEVLALLVLLGYAGVGLFHPQATTYTHYLEPQKKNLFMGIFISMGTLGFAFGPFLSSALVHWGGLRATVFAVIFGLLGALALFRIDRPFQRQAAASPREKNSLSLSFDRGEWWILWLLTLIGVCRSVILVGLPTFMPFIWSRDGFDVVTIGAVIGLSSVVGCPFGLLGGYLGDRLGERTVLLLSFLPGLVLLPLMFQYQGWQAFGLFILLIGFLEASLATSLVLALRGVKRNPNTVSAIVGGLSWGLAGLLMPVIGLLGDAWGLENTLMLMMLPLCFAVVSIVLLPQRTMTTIVPRQA